jgi:hypothetical protein
MSNVQRPRWMLAAGPVSQIISMLRQRTLDPGRWTLDILPNETKADAELDLRDLISAAGAEVSEKARRERLLRHLESADKAHPLELAKYSLERADA